MLLRGRHYRTHQRIDIRCRDGRIESVGPSDDAIPADRVCDTVAPGLFDLQVNGAVGVAFNDPFLDADGVWKVVETCRAHSISRFCPTVITDGFEAIERALTVLRKSRESSGKLAEAMPGFHLEGPYINAESGPRGAHPRHHIRPPDRDEFRRWLEAAGGAIKIVTLAPEWPGAPAFIERLTAGGVVAAIGHTGASAEQIRAAVAAGAKLSTHLGNGCAALLPRHANPIWDQLAEDGLMASVIADGHHLPASVLKSIVRCKTPARTILTCDASPLAGLPPGRYRLWDSEFEVVADGRIAIPGTPYLAGSGKFLDECVQFASANIDVRLEDAIEMASGNPARLLGIEVYDLEVGQRAEFFTTPIRPCTD